MTYGPAEIADAGATAPRGRSDQTQFEGVTLTTSRAELRQTLEDYIAGHRDGQASAALFVERFADDIKTRRIKYMDLSGGTTDEWVLVGIRRDTEILKLLRPLLAYLKEINELMLKLFEARASVLLDRLLAANESAVLSERFRYRLERKSTTTETISVDEFGQEYTEYETEYSYEMTQTPPAESSGIAAACSHLVERLQDVQAKRELEFDAERASYNAAGQGVRNEWTIHLDLAWQEAKAKTEESLRAYDLARIEPENYYPILIRFTRIDPRVVSSLKDVREGLEVLATAPSAAAAQKLYEQTAERVADCDYVRKKIDDEELTTWDVAEVVELTKLGMEIQEGSMQARVINDRAAEIAGAKADREKATSLVMIALGLLAAPLTGGASLSLTGAFIAGAAAVGEIGLTAYLTVEHLQKYRLDKAMAGTNYDRAQALAQEDPSMSWLAWDIVDMAFSAADAIGAFRSISKALRPVIAARREARTAKEIAEANKQLVETSAKLEAEYGEKLAKRVTDEAKAVAEKQAARLEEAAEDWERGLDDDTQRLIDGDPTLKQAMKEIDPEVRAVLTRCAD